MWVCKRFFTPNLVSIREVLSWLWPCSSTSCAKQQARLSHCSFIILRLQHFRFAPHTKSCLLFAPLTKPSLPDDKPRWGLPIALIIVRRSPIPSDNKRYASIFVGIRRVGVRRRRLFLLHRNDSAPNRSRSSTSHRSH
ncbi:hypothetical protein Y032_0656g1228 [Ancylostoma ceylanicum]|uniref:Uncharacterized protein n=1 Tax=Ancylostoma ceylanicum TaxID=53326 RepID=A0A016WK91_9BILA|nr:hypothetical protein Y032_0656g1228 [Ancylostoma ceylanicum]